MKHLFYILLLNLLPSVLTAQDLKFYLRTAAERNPSLQARYKEFEASLQKIPQVNSLPDPVFSFGYFISPVETRVGPQRARFSLSQVFPWFGMLKAQEDAAALTAEARHQAFLDARNKLYYDVSAAYYPLFELSRHIALEEENHKVLVTYKDIATSKFQNGKGAMVDVLRADVMLKEATTSLLVLKQKRKPLATRFNMLLNRPDDEAIVMADTLITGGFIPDHPGDPPLPSHPLLEELELKRQASEAQKTAAVKQGMPKMGAGLDYVVVSRGMGNASDQGKDVVMPMITLSFPIFRQKYKAMEKEARLMQEAFTLQKQDVSNRLTASYDMLRFEVQQQLELLALYDIQTEASEQSLRLLFTEYGHSGRDFEEVLRMQQQLLNYEKMKATALAKYHITLAELDYITAKEK